ncbi:MAG: hypothetical protein AB8G23_09715 [Myxococcota bacterium]
MTRNPTVQESILILGPESRFQSTLRNEVAALPAQVITASDLEDVVAQTACLRQPPSILMIPEAQIDPERIEEKLGELRIRTRAERLVPIAFGRAPSEERRQALREAGIDLALFGRFGRHALRFQINRALSPWARQAPRGELRAPQEWRTRTFSSGKKKTVRCYSLSSRGAYFVTPRPWIVGSEVAFELPLRDERRLIDGRILYTHESGGGDRRTLPGGMAVAFTSMPRDLKDLIQRGVTATQVGLQV